MTPSICLLSCDSFLSQRLCITLADCAEHFSAVRCCYDKTKSIMPPTTAGSVECLGVDWSAPEAFSRCMDGMDLCIVCPPWDGFHGEWAANCAKACQVAGVKDVLVMSWMGAEDASMSQCFQYEQAWRHAYPNCCIMRMAFLQQWFLFFASQVKQGKGLCCPFQGNKPFAPIDCNDVSACMMEAVDKLWLADNRATCAWKGRVLQLTGPKLINGHNVCKLIEDCCDCKCSFSLCGNDECMEALTHSKPIHGVGSCDAWQARCIVNMCAAIQKGSVGHISSDMNDICGMSGNSLDGMLRVCKGEFCQ